MAKDYAVNYERLRRWLLARKSDMTRQRALDAEPDNILLGRLLLLDDVLSKMAELEVKP